MLARRPLAGLRWRRGAPGYDRDRVAEAFWHGDGELAAYRRKVIGNFGWCSKATYTTLAWEFCRGMVGIYELITEYMDMDTICRIYAAQCMHARNVMLVLVILVGTPTHCCTW